MEKRIFASLLWVPLCAMLLALGACSDSEFDRTPPIGMGSIIVDNLTSDDVDVFINGALSMTVDDHDDDFVDVNPGVHRIVISEEGGDASFFDEVDVLAGHLTVLRVLPGGGDTYDVSVSIENP